MDNEKGSMVCPKYRETYDTNRSKDKDGNYSSDISDHVFSRADFLGEKRADRIKYRAFDYISQAYDALEMDGIAVLKFPIVRASGSKPSADFIAEIINLVVSHFRASRDYVVLETVKGYKPIWVVAEIYVVIAFAEVKGEST